MFDANKQKYCSFVEIPAQPQWIVIYLPAVLRVLSVVECLLVVLVEGRIMVMGYACCAVTRCRRSVKAVRPLSSISRGVIFDLEAGRLVRRSKAVVELKWVLDERRVHEIVSLIVSETFA